MSPLPPFPGYLHAERRLILTKSVSLSYAEMYLGLATVLRRFELELFDTVRERDVDVVRDCFVGMPMPEAKGVRVKVLGKRT